MRTDKKPQRQEAGLGPLIERLGPLNNQWREAAPSAKALLLWDMGDLIIQAVPAPSDAVLWDIQTRSYLTRNLLRYALIVRRGWEQRSELAALTAGLRSYTVFREALPFLKGSREGIDAGTYGQVVELLRDPDTRGATSALRRLKAIMVGRQHSKGGSAAAIRDQAGTFRSTLTALQLAAREGTLPPLPPETAVALSQAALALASGEPARELPPAAQAPECVGALLTALNAAIRGGRASAAAFRRIVGPAHLMQAADLLNCSASERGLSEWRRRNAAPATPPRAGLENEP